MASKAGESAVTTSGNQSRSINSGEVKSKSSYYDKQSGSYGRVTTKQSVSSGHYTNRGRDGHKDEYKASSTVRIGDKGGYTEYSKQEKLTRVDYGGGYNKYGGNQVCGGGGYKNHGYPSDGTDAQDDDDHDNSRKGGAGCDDGNVDVDKDDSCDDNDDFDDDNCDFDYDSGDDYCYYDSDD